ncbi:hypothetical protein GV975_25515 [Escherichia coli]|nr:hypothetical protein [Escherichia coli]EIS8899428.1 hypothetical protein [Salmonella enterica]
MQNTNTKNVDFMEFILHIDPKVLREDNKELIQILLNKNTIFPRNEETAEEFNIFLFNISVFQTFENLKINKFNKSKAVKFLRKLKTEEINQLLEMLAVFTMHQNKEDFSEAVGMYKDQATIKVED